MNAGPTYYCWHCYARGDQATGPCPQCGQPVEGRPGLDYTDRLLWALWHPLRERRMMAVLILASRRERRAVQPLRALLDTDPDPYLAAEILTALVSVAGTDNNRDLLNHYASTGPAPARRRAHRLLQHPTLDTP